MQKSEFLKLTISFFQYFWCQNWDQWQKMSGKNTHILSFSWKIIKEGKIPKIKIINFKNSNFSTPLMLPLVHFSKFKTFLWVCWFLGKNLFNFLYPIWKLHIAYTIALYCHNPYYSCSFQLYTLFFLNLAKDEVKWIKSASWTNQ